MTMHTPQPQPVTVVVVPRSTGVAYMLLVLFGLFGLHQFYLGNVGRGISMLFTLGWLGVGWIVDLIDLRRQTVGANAALGITDARLSR